MHPCYYNTNYIVCQHHDITTKLTFQARVKNARDAAHENKAGFTPSACFFQCVFACVKFCFFLL